MANMWRGEKGLDGPQWDKFSFSSSLLALTSIPSPVGDFKVFALALLS